MRRFFPFPNVASLAPRNTGTESTAGERIASTMARKAKIALGPGMVYGDQGADHVRIVFTRELEALQQAVDRIAIALA
jgi:bifunctional pyridoxal-dependent enzyme with beta-cystathionase and maltose regulon repressor activities